MSFLGRALPFLCLALVAGCSTAATDDEASSATESNLDEGDTAPAAGPLKPDATFGTNGTLSLTGPNVAVSAAKRADGSIGVLRSGGALTIILSDGSAQTDVALASDLIGRVHAHKDGLVVVGSTKIDETHGRYFVSRIGSDGAADSAFTPDPLELTANDSAVTKDGKIIVAGSFGERSAIVRLNANGTLDASFGDQGVWLPADDRPAVAKIALGADDSIYALTNGSDHTQLVHIATSGKQDAKFGTGVAELPNAAGSAGIALVMTESGLQYIGPSADEADTQLHAFAIDTHGVVTPGEAVLGSIIGFGSTGIVSAVTAGDACTVHVTEKATTELTAQECSGASYVALGGGKRALVVNGTDGVAVHVFGN